MAYGLSMERMRPLSVLLVPTTVENEESQCGRTGKGCIPVPLAGPWKREAKLHLSSQVAPAPQNPAVCLSPPTSGRV